MLDLNTLALIFASLASFVAAFAAIVRAVKFRKKLRRVESVTLEWSRHGFNFKIVNKGDRKKAA